MTSFSKPALRERRASNLSAHRRPSPAETRFRAHSTGFYQGPHLLETLAVLLLLNNSHFHWNLVRLQFVRAEFLQLFGKIVGILVAFQTDAGADHVSCDDVPLA